MTRIADVVVIRPVYFNGLGRQLMEKREAKLIRICTCRSF